MTIVTFEIVYTYVVRGFGFGFSSNRPQIAHSRFEARMKRVLQNQTENAAYVVPVLAAVHFAGLSGVGVDTASLLIVVGRAAYAVLYYSGVSFIRIPAFSTASLSTLYLAILVLSRATGEG
ncbi:MAG: MAPEG family protein [Myxococcales bacterium]|nr:MAPEG family protein [Myxococcales bacterium]